MFLRHALPVLAALALAPVFAAAGLAGGARAEEARVTGSATYLDRAMLPPGAVLEVVLEDVSLADAPSKVIATDVQENLGAPPYPFELVYDPAGIDARNSYTVRARVTLGDRLLMTTDTFAPVLTRGAGTQVDVTMVRVAGQQGDDRPESTWTAPGLRLPASFTGEIPMASGPGTTWHLDLWPDQVFHLRQVSGAGMDASDIGRWHADAERNAIVLQGGREAPVFLEVRGNGDLRLMDREGAPIESDLPYTLTAGPLDPAEVALPMGGMFRYMADAALFSECLTGRSYPVAMEGAYIDAERGYLELGLEEPGAPVFAVLEGRLTMRPAMEGPDRTHLVIERFSRFAPGETCERNMATASLTNTYWKILEIAGEAIDVVEDRREPHLILRAGEDAAFNATVGCNMMRGGYSLEDGELAFGNAAMTMMACPPPLDTRELALAEALSRVATWAVNGNTLELFDAEGTRVLMAEAVYLP